MYMTVRLYLPSPLANSNEQLPIHIHSQLAACRSKLENGSAGEMQAIFPEGFAFSYLFYGLAWVEVGLRDEDSRLRATKEVEWALQFVESQDAKAPFPPELPPDHGMFYSAWRAHLLGGLAMLAGAESPHVVQLRAQCDTIAEHLKNSKTPFPPSYVSSAWPCDTLPAIHAMATHDHVTGQGRYAELIKAWLQQSRIATDDETSMISHLSDPNNGRPLSGARATSQSIILRMLPDIDPQLAKQQYLAYRKCFRNTFVGLPSVMEYPNGVRSGTGDIDSGPLIFGRSLSATVMDIGLGQIYGDQEWADALAVTGEAVSFPYNLQGKRTYAFGILPIGEVMVTYSYSARPWFSTDHQPETRQELSSLWRLPTTLVTVCLTAITFWRWRRRSQLQST